jgi:hypothetical protein
MIDPMTPPSSLSGLTKLQLWATRARFCGFLLTIPIGLMIAGCATRDHAYRSVTYTPKPPSEGFQCLESVKSNPRARIAYLEYGTHGHRLREEQMNVARQTLRNMQSHGKPVVLVSYVHGWKHGSLSGDALQFREFIDHLADIGEKRNFEVMGVYCAWPGAFWNPLERVASPTYEAPEPGFFTAPFVATVPEQLTAWDRYTVAHQVAAAGNLTGDLKELTRQLHEANEGNIALSVGHSMGAFILELGIVRDMAKEGTQGRAATSPDIVLLMNSAAPAILAKRAINEWNGKNCPENPSSPRVVSITSDADWATGDIAPLGFIFGPTNPMMRRIWKDCQPSPGEWDDMLRCPGHTGHLFTWYTNRMNPKEWAPACGKWADQSGKRNLWYFSENLRWKENEGSLLPPRQFMAKDGRGNGHLWHFNWEESKVGKRKNGSPYWVVQTGPSLICSHGDIWDTQSVSVMLAAVYESGILSKFK